jgi:hypothetical protein
MRTSGARRARALLPQFDGHSNLSGDQPALRGLQGTVNVAAAEMAVPVPTPEAGEEKGRNLW